MGVVGIWTGQQAADLRSAYRLSIVAFAEYLGVAEGTVSKWEKKLSDVVPTPAIQQVLDVALQRAPAEVQDRFALLSCGYRHSSNGPDPLDQYALDADLNRRELLRLLSMTGPALAISSLDGQIDWERLNNPHGESRQAEFALLNEYEKLNAHLWRVYAQAKPKVAAFPLANDQLKVLTARLQQPNGTVAHERLCALTSDLFQLTGEIFFDENRYTDAAQCYTMAATAAMEANAFDLWACAMTRHSFIGVYERNFERSIPMLEMAARLANRGDTALSSRHWVNVVQAQAFAGLGDLTACQRALGAAEQVRQLKGPVHNGGWLRFDGARIAEERGACFVELQRPDLAESALNDALKPDLSTRRKGSVLTDLALLGVQRHDSAEIVTHANAALDTARQTGSGVVVRKLQSLQAHLTPFLGDSNVRDLNARITALAGNHTT